MHFSKQTELDSSIKISDYINPRCYAPQSIFITGATGFLGTYLVAEILSKTSATLYCLVRGDRGQELNRIRDNLKRCCLYQQKYVRRIIPVCGDLSKPFPSLTDDKFHELATF